MPPHPIQTAWDADLVGGDPLSFPGYAARLPTEESVDTGVAVVPGADRDRRYAFVSGRFDVLGGSMGVAHGEKVVRAFGRAVEQRLPMVVLCSSGGARMQEGMLALLQMARTASAAQAHAAAGLLSLAIWRSPTTGGVLASYGSLADVRAAEPGATVGFAGPRVVEMTLGTRLPEGSHTAESAYSNALVDALVAPPDQPAWIESALGWRDAPLPMPPPAPVPDPIGPGASAWDIVKAARSARRPTGIHWAARLCRSWTELRGTDPVVRAGLATIAGAAHGPRRAVVIAMDRFARDGRPRPAGYRLARRAVALAGRLELPLLTLIDTPGAHPGPESEADGIASEIARTFAAMAGLPSPSVGVCVGEGGSGGALALGATDRLLIQQGAVFSVIAPEGAAAILERDASRAPELASRLGLTSGQLASLGVVDEVVPDTESGLLAAVDSALSEAVPGQRDRRFAAATARWLREP
ncbi:MAG: carboxyl transferase domain-containing protein [Acidimicrobiales bacterium]